MFSDAIPASKLSTHFGRFLTSRMPRARSLSRWVPRRPVLGIELNGQSLFLACFQFSLGRRPHVFLGSIPNFALLSPEELGKKLREFLQPLNGEEAVISLGLPRSEVMVRFLELPVAAKKSLSEAIALQVEMYKPTDTESFDWDSTVVEERERLAVTLLFTPHPTVEKFANLFAQAGCPLSRIMATQFSLTQAFLRARQGPDNQRYLLLDYKDSGAELALIEGARLVDSRSFPVGGEADAAPQIMAQIQLAFSSLRWKESGEYVALLVRAVPEPVRCALRSLGMVERLAEKIGFPGLPDRPGLQKYTGAAAVALASLTARRRPYCLNLLPAALRPASDRLRYLPTYALLAANVALLLAIGLRVPVENYFLLQQYRKEIAGARIRTDEMKQLLQSGRSMRQELLAFDAFQQHGRQPLEALNEIARKLPSDTWVNTYSCKKDLVELTGSAKAASPLLPLFQSSSQFQDVKFNGALSQDSAGAERFRLQLHLKEKP